MKSIRRAGALDVGKLLFVGVLWGASFILIAIALRSYGPISVAAGRILLAAAVLLVISYVTRQCFPTAFADWQKMIVIGALNSALPFFLISWSMQSISSMVAAALLWERPIGEYVQSMSVMAMIVLGVVSTALAYVVRLDIIKTIGAVFMAQAGHLVPLFGVIWSWAFLSEEISVNTPAALSIILIGIAVTRKGT